MAFNIPKVDIGKVVNQGLSAEVNGVLGQLGLAADRSESFLRNIEQVRVIGDWARSYLWDIKFFNPNISNNGVEPFPLSPFDEWFPAVDVDEPFFDVNSQTFTFYNRPLNIPITQGGLKLNITFMDSENRVLTRWFKQWVEVFIFNNGEYVSTLSECLRKIAIRKLNHERQITEETVYFIYPDQTFGDSLKSDNALSQFTLSFTVAAYTRNNDIKVPVSNLSTSLLRQGANLISSIENLPKPSVQLPRF